MLYTGEHGFASYLGHIKVTSKETAKCSCGKMGYVETVASAPAIVRCFETHEQLKFSTGIITLEEVVLAARSGNEAAKRAFEITGTWLGIAVSNVMNIVDPGIITVGGGVVLAADKSRFQGKENPFLKATIERALACAHRRVAAKTVMRQARYGNDGGMIGAALLADPTIL